MTAKVRGWKNHANKRGEFAHLKTGGPQRKSKEGGTYFTKTGRRGKARVGPRQDPAGLAQPATVNSAKAAPKQTLARLAVAGRARHRYDRGVQVFVEWLRVFDGPRIEALPVDRLDIADSLELGKYFSAAWAQSIDGYFSDFVELAYISDPLDISARVTVFSRWELSEVFCGITDKCPELKGSLPRTQRLLKAWALEGQPVRAPPMNGDIVCALIGWAFVNNFIGLAIGILLMFFALLRPHEFFSLRKRDIAVGYPSVLALWNTKTSRKKIASESATLNDVQGVAILKCLLLKYNIDDFLWSQTQGEFRDLFRHALSQFQIQTPFRLYSLRRGGASRLATILSMDDVIVRGRWASQKTARVYIESARAELIPLTESSHVMEKVKKYKKIASTIK